jgi:hypothetical protein
MGNCQAAELATVVIHHPGSKIERIYWSVSAHEVMNSNPGHYVALVVSSPTLKSENGLPLKHLKLLRPDDTLLIGQVYRLISFEGTNDQTKYTHVATLPTLGSDPNSIFWFTQAQQPNPNSSTTLITTIFWFGYASSINNIRRSPS